MLEGDGADLPGSTRWRRDSHFLAPGLLVGTGREGGIEVGWQVTVMLEIYPDR